MQPYGRLREHPMDNKRRYLNSAMSHEDQREERHDKRVARAAGKAEIAAQLDHGNMAPEDIDHERDREDGLVLSLEEWEQAEADGIDTKSHAAMTAWVHGRRAGAGALA